VTVIGQDRVDPVAQRPQPDQLRRCRSIAPSWRTPGGAIHASGSRSARSSWAKIAASALVVLQPFRGDGLALAAGGQVRIEAVVLQQLHQPAPALCGFERRTAPPTTSGPALTRTSGAGLLASGLFCICSGSARVLRPRPRWAGSDGKPDGLVARRRWSAVIAVQHRVDVALELGGQRDPGLRELQIA